MATKRAQPQISFDEFNRLRILDAEHSKHSESIAEDAAAFIDKLGAFNRSVEGLVGAYNQQANKLEAEKLKVAPPLPSGAPITARVAFSLSLCTSPPRSSVSSLSRVRCALWRWA